MLCHFAAFLEHFAVTQAQDAALKKSFTAHECSYTATLKIEAVKCETGTIP
jgi:hypothetical protein